MASSTPPQLYDVATGGLVPTGVTHPYAGFTAPAGWLMAYGQTVSRTTYANLFSVIVPLVGTATVTIASPGVWTLNNHGFQNGDAIYLTTTGALPTGLSANTIYYVYAKTTNTFELTSSRLNAGTVINTSGSQSGTHSVFYCPYGLGDGSTTFGIPDMRSRVAAGFDGMGGTLANIFFNQQNNVPFGNQGASGGEPTHTQTTAEIAQHAHAQTVDSSYNVPTTGGTANKYAQNNNNFSPAVGSGLTTATAGSSTPMNNAQPTIIMNYIIKT